MSTHETYVSIEVAKLLKQVGFDWDCHGIYVLDSENDSEPVFSSATFKNHGIDVEGYIKLPSPTLAVAQRWLREVKGFECQIACGIDENGKKSYVTELINPDMDLEDYKRFFPTYESTLDACIKKCLEIILEKRNKNYDSKRTF